MSEQHNLLMFPSRGEPSFRWMSPSLRDLSLTPTQLAKATQRLAVYETLVPLIRGGPKKREILEVVIKCLHEAFGALPRQEEALMKAVVDEVLRILSCLTCLLDGSVEADMTIANSVLDATTGGSLVIAQALGRSSVYVEMIKDLRQTASASISLKPELQKLTDGLEQKRDHTTLSLCVKKLHTWKDSLRAGQLPQSIISYDI